MKYKKLVLSNQTIGLIKDRLQKITKGIYKLEGSWGNIQTNPTSRKINWSKCFTTVCKCSPVTVHTRDLAGEKIESRIVIPSEHISMSDTVFRHGAVFYLSEKQIFVKDGNPDSILKKNHLQKFNLLSRDLFDSKSNEEFELSEEKLDDNDEYHKRYFNRYYEDFFDEEEESDEVLFDEDDF